MKHLIKKAVMAAIAIALVYVGYMAIQRYYASKKASEVQVQFLNFGTSDSSYDRGYADAQRDIRNR